LGQVSVGAGVESRLDVIAVDVGRHNQHGEPVVAGVAYLAAQVPRPFMSGISTSVISAAGWAAAGEGVALARGVEGCLDVGGHQYTRRTSVAGYSDAEETRHGARTFGTRA
jgi:hypothetical protein